MGFQVAEKYPLKIHALDGEIEIARPLSLEEFANLATEYPDYRMERESDGKVTIMSPVKRKTGKREASVFLHLGNYWERKLKMKGEIYGPSIGIKLPTTAVKSPDACWVSDERLAALPEIEEDEGWLCAVPDFVVEVRSGSDSLDKLKKKMKDTWQANGVRLGWLIDPAKEQTWIYRTGEAEPELVKGFTKKKLSGEDVLSGFELPLEKLRLKKS
ncbi:MAG: Uma2 family endonuclease [Bacteroidota bacterium]